MQEKRRKTGNFSVFMFMYPSPEVAQFFVIAEKKANRIDSPFEKNT